MNVPQLFEKYYVERLPIYTPPFGLDDKGQKVATINGSSIRSTVLYMQEVVRSEAGATLPPTLAPERRVEELDTAAESALQDLLAMLNASFHNRNFRSQQNICSTLRTTTPTSSAWWSACIAKPSPARKISTSIAGNARSPPR